MDPEKKQYGSFAAIISFLFSVFWNFLVVNMFKGSYGYGYPFDLGDSSGFGEFMLRIFNTLIIGFFLVVPIYLGLKWMRDKGVGY
ncbi:MAG: hypothetical protein Q9M91_00465 [Candidatus Dojkabacteria bacterium]|nr:hypothetical protein [Candidatus Dojkabacteria bacterium]MDQ7020303.1 hypothetical protein [Candidatus Dojkabacteria bacterium]